MLVSTTTFWSFNQPQLLLEKMDSNDIDRSLGAVGEFVAESASGSGSLPSAEVVSPDVDEVPVPDNVIQNSCVVCGLKCSVTPGLWYVGPLKKNMMELVQLHLNISLKETDANKKDVGLCNICRKNLRAWNFVYTNIRTMRNQNLSLPPSPGIMSNERYCLICFDRSLPFRRIEGEVMFTNCSSTETPQLKLTSGMAMLIAQLKIQVERKDDYGVACSTCLRALRTWLSWKLKNLPHEQLASHMIQLCPVELNTASQNRGLKRKRSAEPNSAEDNE